MWKGEKKMDTRSYIFDCTHKVAYEMMPAFMDSLTSDSCIHLSVEYVGCPQVHLLESNFVLTLLSPTFPSFLFCIDTAIRRLKSIWTCLSFKRLIMGINRF